MLIDRYQNLLAASLLVAWILSAPPARAQVAIFSEDFDGAGGPVGWTMEEGWLLSGATASTGSGSHSLEGKGNASAAAVTPPIDLRPASSATLSYLARRTPAYGVDNLIVTASADGGSTFPFTLMPAGEAAPSDDSKWLSVSVALPATLLGKNDVRIQFEGQGQSSSGSTVRLDDVLIEADVPLELSPTSLWLSTATGTTLTGEITAINRSSEPLTVRSPIVRAEGFAIDPAVALEIAAGTSQTYTVTFSPTALGVVTGSIELDYVIGTASLAVTGAAGGGTLSFATDLTTVNDGESRIEVPLHLSYTAIPGLQGLQFRVAWDSDDLTATSVERGSAVADVEDWTLSSESGPGHVDVVLLGEEALGRGTYEDFILIGFDTESIASDRTIPLTIEGAIGAMAEAQGSDANLTASSMPHVLTFSSQEATFEASATMLDLGDVLVGEQASRTLTVSNNAGSGTLVITDISVSSELYSVSPLGAEIAPNETEDFTITFMPTFLSFGRQTSEIMFTHSGESAVDTIELTGKGRGGRGDAEGDGTVDALDVVHAIDFVLQRLSPNAMQTAAADLFPFPDGDELLDVRDLTVLLQAVVNGQWPDGVELPEDESNAAATAGGGNRLTVDPTVIELAHDEPIRAFQIVLPASAGAAVDIETSDVGATVESNFNKATGELRILVFRMDGSLIEPGAMRIATVGVLDEPRYVTLIGEQRERLRLDSSTWTSIGMPPTEEPLVNPYPNPFRPGVDMLKLPVQEAHTEVTIYNVLGREVFRTSSGDEWDGRDMAGRYVAPGVYVVEVKGKKRRAVPLVIVR